MTILRTLRQLFFSFDERPEFIFAKVRALHYQIPLLYFILGANVVSTGIAHYEDAPIWLTVVPPAIAVLVGFIRGLYWYRMDPETITLAEAKYRLRALISMAAPFVTLFIVWSIGLAVYSGPFGKGQLALFMALTCAASMLCLVHVRAAALQLGAITIIPFATYFFLDPDLPSKAIAINAVLALGALTFVVIRQHKSFFDTISQKHEIEQKNIETQKLSDENLRLATRDTLTGLPNRRSFILELRQSIATRAAEGGSLALILFDLDGFKPVNDLYGHAAGDSLLVKVAARLRDNARGSCSVARLGGDEFAIIMPGASGTKEITEFTSTVCAMISQPYRLPQAEVTITASAGITILNTGTLSDAELIEQADYALYQAKDSMNGVPVVFNTEHAHTIKLLHEVDKNLRSGTLERELALVYQPITLAATGSIVAFEALARWNNEQLGMISPSVFIPAAGRSGLGSRMTQTLFRILLEEMKQIPDEMPVSFNLAARDLVNISNVLRIVSDIQNSEITPKRIQFEVTEATITADFDKIQQSLRMLRNMGCSISIDNFGSGQSILSYIYRLPISSVKIDSKFIGECERSEPARKTLQAIVNLCDSLDLTCVAVGIETPSQAKLAADLGCTCLQGFHIAKPHSLREARKLAMSSAA